VVQKNEPLKKNIDISNNKDLEENIFSSQNSDVLSKVKTLKEGSIIEGEIEDKNEK